MISLLGSLLSLSGIEDSHYTVLNSQGPFEIRLYHRMSIARIQAQGNLIDSFNEGRKHLCDYLEGSNLRLEKIENRSLFLQYQKQNVWEIGVILKSIRLSSDIPRPINRLVRLEELSPCKVAALKCSRIFSEDTFECRSNELRKWLDKKSYTAAGTAKILHYPNYLQLPYYRDKEILIDVL